MLHTSDFAAESCMQEGELLSNRFRWNRTTTQAIWVYVNPSGCTSPEGGSQLLSAVAYLMILYFFKVSSVSCSALNKKRHL